MAYTLDHRFIGIPYVDRGRDPAVGLDCWGLPRHFYDVVKGIDLPSLLDGYRSAKDHAAVTALVMQESAGWAETSTPVFGDLVTLRVAGRPWHVGIWLDDRHFLHTLEGVGSCIGRLDSPLWVQRIDKFWRYERAH